MTFLQRLGFLILLLCAITCAAVAWGLLVEGLILPAAVLGVTSLLAFSRAEHLLP